MLTNYENIKNMSVKEMAKFINKVEQCKGKAFYNCDDKDCWDCAGCTDNTIKWLESEVADNG